MRAAAPGRGRPDDLRRHRHDGRAVRPVPAGPAGPDRRHRVAADRQPARDAAGPDVVALGGAVLRDELTCVGPDRRRDARALPLRRGRHRRRRAVARAGASPSSTDDEAEVQRVGASSGRSGSSSSPTARRSGRPRTPSSARPTGSRRSSPTRARRPPSSTRSVGSAFGVEIAGSTEPEPRTDGAGRHPAAGRAAARSDHGRTRADLRGAQAGHRDAPPPGPPRPAAARRRRRASASAVDVVGRDLAGPPGGRRRRRDVLQRGRPPLPAARSDRRSSAAMAVGRSGSSGATSASRSGSTCCGTRSPAWPSPGRPARAFIREVLTGVYESDLGMIEPRIGEIAGYRTRSAPTTSLLFDNIQPEFASAIGRRTVADRARGAAFLGVDAILISGPAAGIVVRDERPPAGQGGRAGRRRSSPTPGCRADTGRRDLRGRRRRDRRDEPQGATGSPGTRSIRIGRGRLMDAARTARARPVG